MTAEIKIQSAFFQRTWNELPQTRRLLFAVPNGGTRNKVEASQLVASGMVAGIPDIVFLWDGKAYGIEFKTEIGRTSKEQDKVHETWTENNIPVMVFRDSDSAFEYIKSIIHENS